MFIAYFLLIRPEKSYFQIRSPQKKRMASVQIPLQFQFEVIKSLLPFEWPQNS